MTDGLAAYDSDTMTYYSSDGFSNIYRVDLSSNSLQSTINFGFQNISRFVLLLRD